MMHVVRRINRVVGGIVAVARWLVLPLALLLLAQWPLRELVQRFSREANDLGQVLFALYAAVALTCATRAGSHVATDVLAHRYPPRVRHALIRGGIALTVVPWALYLLTTSAQAVWRSLAVLESFPETYNPGYFVVKVALWLLGGLVLLQSLVLIADPARHEAP